MTREKKNLQLLVVVPKEILESSDLHAQDTFQLLMYFGIIFNFQTSCFRDNFPSFFYHFIDMML